MKQLVHEAPEGVGHSFADANEMHGDASAELSKTVRTLALGALATSWGLLVLKPELSFPLSDESRALVVAGMATAIAALLLDAGQRTANYYVAWRLVNVMELQEYAGAQLETEAPSYRIVTTCHVAKVVVAAISALCLIVGIALSFPF